MLADRKEVTQLTNPLKKDESEIKVTSLEVKAPARRKTSKLNVVDDVEDSDKDKRKKGAVESRQSHNLEVDN